MSFLSRGALTFGVVIVIAGVSTAAHAQQPPTRESPYRNPAGSVNLTGVLGANFGSFGTSFVAGVGIGYAVVTGVLPGVRGIVIAGDTTGAEAAGTLTLTPPFKGYLTPFVVGEGGRRWERGFTGWMYGVGGGLYLGEPLDTVVFQLGWIQRWYVLDDRQTASLGSPILSFQIRF